MTMIFQSVSPADVSVAARGRRRALVDHGHAAQHLHRHHLAHRRHALANLAHVNWVVVALGVCVLVDGVGVLPGLGW